MNYRKLYVQLMNTCAIRNGVSTNQTDTKEGFENHHLVPRCLGGDEAERRTLVRLTYREHALAHRILDRMGHDSLCHTWLAMSMGRALNTKQVAIIREATRIKEKARLSKAPKKPKRVQCKYCRNWYTSSYLSKHYISCPNMLKSEGKDLEERFFEKVVAYLTTSPV